MRRIKANSIIHCNNDINSIKKAFDLMLSGEFSKNLENCDNPYEGKSTSESIVTIIKKTLDNGIDLKKKFYNLEIKE